MALGCTRAGGLRGVEGFAVGVEADVAPGLPSFSVVGLADSACGQAPDRIRAAGSNCGHPIPMRRITVNLSPASERKIGSRFDLGIAVAVLAAAGEIPVHVVRDVVHVGELGLDATVRAVPGVLPVVLAAVRAGGRHVVVPVGNATEARLVSGARVHPVAHLAELVERYRRIARGQRPEPIPEPPAQRAPEPRWLDLADVLGQHEARMALEVAAAGSHHVYLVGPPGAGKSMLAERLPGLLPDLDDATALEVTAIQSVLGGHHGVDALHRRAPFVAPHHGASMPSIIGGGSGWVTPGAITAAHGGVLFLDEAPEFKPNVMQALRQPMESGTVLVARATGRYRFPCRFQLVLAANPCPCGHAHGKAVACSCTPLQRRSYAARLAGPILDRVDLQVQVPAPSRAVLAAGPAETSAVVAARVASARAAAAERWRAQGAIVNARIDGTVLRAAPFRLPREYTAELDRAVDRGQLSLRGYDRCLRLAWSVADLAGRAAPSRADVGMALALRHRPAVAA